MCNEYRCIIVRKNHCLGALAFGTLLVSFSSGAIAKDLTIKVHTKHYSVQGNSTFDLAHSMTQKGPYSFELNNRVWATTDRRVRWKLVWKKSRGQCRVQNAIVRLKITYTLPKLRRSKSTDAKTKRKWNKMLAILTRHEKQHGKLFARFSKDVQNGLLHLKPVARCRDLNVAGEKLVNRLARLDLQRNERFEIKDRPNYQKMSRIIHNG